MAADGTGTNVRIDGLPDWQTRGARKNGHRLQRRTVIKRTEARNGSSFRGTLNYATDEKYTVL